MAQEQQVVQAGLVEAFIGSPSSSSSSSSSNGDYDLLYQWERVGHRIHVRSCCSVASARQRVKNTTMTMTTTTAMEIEEEEEEEDSSYELTLLEGDSAVVDFLVVLSGSGASATSTSTSTSTTASPHSPLRFIAAFEHGRVASWAVTKQQRQSQGGVAVLEAEADVGDTVTAIRVLKSDASGAVCLVGTSSRGVQHVVFQWKRTGAVASASVVDRMRMKKDAHAKDAFGFGSSGPSDAAAGAAGHERSQPKGLLRNVFQTFTRYGGFGQQEPSEPSPEGAAAMGKTTTSPNTSSSACRVHSMEVVFSKEDNAKLVVLDEEANLWLWRATTGGGHQDTNLVPLERSSLKRVCLKALDFESWFGHNQGAQQTVVDEQNLLVTPLDVTFVPGTSQEEIAVLALIQDKETEAFDRVAMLIFSLRENKLAFVRYVVLSDEWLVGLKATMNLRLKLKIAKDLNSVVVKGNDGHALAFAGNVHTMHEVAAIHTNKYVWDACSFSFMGQVQFLFLMHDLTCNTLSQSLLDMCNNIVEALPKQLADQYSTGGGASGALGAVDIQLKDKLEQHFQFLNLLHSRGWLDMLHVKTAGRIVRAGEHVAALQCIRSKEKLLQEQSMQDQQNMGLAGASGGGSKSVSLNLIQSIIQDAGEQIASSRETLEGGPNRRQPWEVFYSKPLSSVLFLDMIERKVDALINQPIFEISKERALVASTKDVQVQNAILNVLSRTVTETLNAVESWIRAVDASGIPALPGAFGHQEGYSWTSCPSLCNSLSALSRLCLHYHSQWKTKAPNMVPKLSIQLHSLITQYLTVCDAFLQATPQEEKTRNPQAFKKYIEGGEEILGALLEASYEESNHMIQDAVAELAEVHGCYSVLYDLCEKTNDIDRLCQYMRMVQPEVSKLGDVEKSGFAAYAFERLIAANRIRDVLELPPEFNESLNLYLSRSPDHQHLLFLHLARMQCWDQCSKVDTPASKLLQKVLHKAGSVGQ
jgi:hypothetical protein